MFEGYHLARTPPPAGEVARPVEGEETGAQRKGGGIGDFAGVASGIPGFGKPPAGTFATYRKMRSNPTIALARVVELAPIKATKWSFEQKEGAPPGALELVKDALESIMPLLVGECVRSMDFGFTPFEKVWEIRRVDGVARLTLRKLKPLLIDITEPLVDKEDGSFRGLKQGKVEIGSEKVFWFTYDGEPGNEWFGRSKNENLRKAYKAWEDLFDKAGRYATLAAGPVPLIQYPEGTARDKNGKEVDAYEIASGLLQAMQSGKGVIMPNTLAKYASTLAEKGIPLDTLKAWIFDFLEPKARYGDDFVKLLTHAEKLLVRGRLAPERAVLEGEHGTKADSEVHTDIVLSGADEFLTDLRRCVNWFIINPLLMLNYGEAAKGMITAEPAPLVDEKLALIREMVKTVLTAPQNRDLFLDVFGLAQSMEMLNLPRNEGDDDFGLPRLDEDDPDESLTNMMLSLFGGMHRRVRALAS